MTTQLTTERVGWGHPGYARKMHYFCNHDSICGRYNLKNLHYLRPDVTERRKCVRCVQILKEVSV